MSRLVRWFSPVIFIPLLASSVHADTLADLARDYARSRTSGVRTATTTTARLMVPSFARQTGLACSACHYQFLGLTAYGRAFKLNGYTLTARQFITEKDSLNGGKLNLSPFSLISGMATAGLTHLKTAVPGSQNDATLMPQEFSVFVAGQITSRVGMFSQFTYAGADGSFGIDNIDIRYANHTSGTTRIVYGATLNNNPSIQDLWNTTPAWGFPFIGSDAAVGPTASPVIDGAFSQNVLGLGAYTMIGGLVYGEISVYHSAIQGQAAPNDASGAIKGVAPYWRLALQKEWPHQSLMLGTFGMHASVYPDVLSGPTNAFTDIGVDGQFETRAGRGNIVARGTFMHEKQTLDAAVAAGAAANTTNTLNAFRLNASYYPNQWLGLTAGYFQTTGSTDALLYAPNPVDGSANGSPKSSGFIGELDFNPWENTRLGLQYTGYGKFNGGSTNYDGSGRDASGNNSLLAFVWLAF